MPTVNSMWQRILRVVVVALAAATIPAIAQPQAYPTRVIKIAVPYPADGYTLLMASNGLTTNMALFPDLPFDGRKDFTPIARIGYAPLVIVVPASSPAKSLKDLIAMARAKPGDLTYGPDDFARFISNQTEIWSAVIKKSGIRPD
jgi:tripartite-type tricarboxylate transporter receptor subunit TctC